MQAGVDFIKLVNADTLLTDRVKEYKIKEFWDNLGKEDKQEMAGWSYEEFLERVNKAYCYYLKRGNSIIAIGGTYPDDLNICLWLLVVKQATKYPLSLIKAVRKALKKDLKGYSLNFNKAVAIPYKTSFKHHKFIETILQMKLATNYEDYKIFVKDKKELLECVNQ